MKERVKRLTRAIAWLQLRGACGLFSGMWFFAQIAYIYTLGPLEMDDVPMHAARRD
ncbi:unnamed protein product, partial [Sphacelaria rigidula]